MRGILCLALFLACLGGPAPAAPGRTDPVSVVAYDGWIVITNNGTDDVYYAVHEESSLQWVSWSMTCDNSNRIVPGESLHVPAKPHDYQPTGRAVVFLWDFDHRNVRGVTVRIY